MQSDVEALYKLSATEIVAMRRRRELSATDLVEASINRIEQVDGTVNAIPIRCFEQALDTARRHDSSTADADLLQGLPIAVKDYNDLEGVETTYGSPVFANNIATESDITVAQLQRNGAIAVGKSNVPEWAGGHTFNPVFGATRNPWNPALSAGGSSGGSAAALATGQVWLATGNDLGGSLRTPASFNGVVGLRPGPGVVPGPLRYQPHDVLWVEGPMGRCVSDVALMLDASAGKHIGDPLSFEPTGESFQQFIHNHKSPARVAFSEDLGIVPMSREVADVCRAGAEMFSSLGAEVTEDAPDFTGALEGFQTLRALLVATMMGPLLEQHRHNITPEIVGNIEKGLALRVEDIMEAERIRRDLYHRMATFFESHDYLICPAASITPFPVEQRYVEEIEGKPCDTYIDWFAITFAITMTSCPTISLPCGFSKDGMPIGMQIVGKPRGEAELLRDAYQLEQTLGMSASVPIDPRTAP
ncbi:MAG: amidase family protein [Pseudomonadota bacterium]